MIPVPTGARVWLATGWTDMRKGFDGLASLVQDHLQRDPFSGQAFVFRGRQGRLVKILWWDGQGLREGALRVALGSERCGGCPEPGTALDAARRH